MFCIFVYVCVTYSEFKSLMYRLPKRIPLLSPIYFSKSTFYRTQIFFTSNGFIDCCLLIHVTYLSTLFYDKSVIFYYKFVLILQNTRIYFVWCLIIISHQTNTLIHEQTNTYTQIHTIHIFGQVYQFSTYSFISQRVLKEFSCKKN